MIVSKVISNFWFNKFANFKGRATRKEFWIFHLKLLGVLFLVSIASITFQFLYFYILESKELLCHFNLFGALINSAYFVLAVYIIAIMIPHLAVCQRRLHDCDTSDHAIDAFFLLVPDVFLLALIPLLIPIIGFWRGLDGDNRYGKNPYKPAATLSNPFDQVKK